MGGKPGKHILLPLTPDEAQMRAHLQQHVQVLAQAIGGSERRALPKPVQSSELYRRTITLDIRSALLLQRVSDAFRRGTSLPAQGAAAPSSILGVGWSDHWSFWQFGYRALMVTDTAPYRYPRYHTAEDTPEKLDYDRMARAVTGLAAVIRELASP